MSYNKDRPLEVYTDASGPDRGFAGIGALVFGREFWAYVRARTTLEAEFKAVIFGLKVARQYAPNQHLIVWNDNPQVRKGCREPLWKNPDLLRLPQYARLEGELAPLREELTAFEPYTILTREHKMAHRFARRGLNQARQCLEDT